MVEFKVSDGAELARRCGFSRSLIGYWKERPDAKPQPAVLANIEAALGIRFVPEGSRNPQDYILAGRLSPSRATSEMPPIPDDRDIPGSAREIYEGNEFVGGKLDWLDLSEDARSYYEGLYLLMLKQIDRANDEYMNGLRELMAVRESRIAKAVSDCTDMIEKKMIRQFE